MTIREFQAHSEADQTEILYLEAVYIDKRKSGEFSILLYQLEGFYVEVCFSKYRQVVAWIRCSESVQILTPYLDKMDIVELMVNRDF